MPRKPQNTDQKALIHERRRRERGAIIKQGRVRVAILKPSTYFVGMSSLGMQCIYRAINEIEDVFAERTFTPDHPDDPTAHPLLSYETVTPVGDAHIIAVSIAYELEIADLVRSLRLAGIPPLASDRNGHYPIVVLGGPLTFSNPLPVAPFADLVVLGEGEEVIGDIVRLFRDARRRDDFLEQAAQLPGVMWPARDGEALPSLAQVPDDRLPAVSVIRTPDTELSDMHLVEAERGCHRKCTFCVMRRSTNGGMRLVDPDTILETIPPDATRVGLVGAAVSDHPKLLDIVTGIVDSGRGCSLSSLRADRLTAPLLEALRAGGLRSITIASDGASERLRRQLEKNIREKHLRLAAELAAESRLKLKVYMMLGVPGETDEDIDELAVFTRELAQHTRVSLGIAPFVAKRNTPLDGHPFAGIKLVERRVSRLRRQLQGTAEIRSISARWAWVEFQLAQGGSEMAAVAIAAVDAGGGFAAWKRAIAQARGERPIESIERLSR